jgi:predicted nuclease with TOPRIM domain
MEQIQSLNDTISNLKNQLNDQATLEEFEKKHQEEIQLKEDEIKKLTQENESLSEEIQNMKALSQQNESLLKEQINILQNNIEKKNKEFDEVQNQNIINNMNHHNELSKKH